MIYTQKRNNSKGKKPDEKFHIYFVQLLGIEMWIEWECESSNIQNGRQIECVHCKSENFQFSTIFKLDQNNNNTQTIQFCDDQSDDSAEHAFACFGCVSFVFWFFFHFDSQFRCRQAAIQFSINTSKNTRLSPAIFSSMCELSDKITFVPLSFSFTFVTSSLPTHSENFFSFSFPHSAWKLLLFDLMFLFLCLVNQNSYTAPLC